MLSYFLATLLLLLLLGAQVPIPEGRKLKGWNILKIWLVCPDALGLSCLSYLVLVGLSLCLVTLLRFVTLSRL